MEEGKNGGAATKGETNSCGPESCSSIGVGTWQGEQATSRDAAITEARKGGQQKCKDGDCAGSKRCTYVEVENRDTNVEVREHESHGTQYRVTVTSSGRCRCE